MTIIINEFSAAFPVEPPQEGELAGRVGELERHVRALEANVRELTRYCEVLENACREALAETPGRFPFPRIMHR